MRISNHIKVLIIQLSIGFGCNFAFAQNTVKGYASAITSSYSKQLKSVVNDQEEAQQVLQDLPSLFLKNVGQWDNLTGDNDSKILYQGTAKGWNANVWFMKDQLSYGFMREKETEYTKEDVEEGEVYELLVWNMKFLGSNPEVTILDEGKSDSHTNYLIGNDVTKHATNVPNYNKINYNNLYPHIDVSFYYKENYLKYDYIIYPRGNVRDIQHYCEGTNKLQINDDGKMEISTDWGTLIEEIPHSYQNIQGRKQLVNVGYTLINDSTYGFVIHGSYDESQPIIIDPIVLNWGTNIEPSSLSSYIYIYDIAKDNAGNIYATRIAMGNTFPVVAGSYDVGYNGNDLNPYSFGGDAFVLKLSKDGTNLIYSTYYGGERDENGSGIVINTAGEAFIVGGTTSPNLPTIIGAWDNVYESTVDAFGRPNTDLFVVRLNASGSALIYATYIGGKGNDGNKGGGDAFSEITINNNNEAFVVGQTGSNDFPVTLGAYQMTNNGGEDAFVLKINALGTNLIYSTLLGGTASDRANAIEINANGEAFITGGTRSTDFPTSLTAYDATYNGGLNGDAFVAKLDANGSNIIYSTYIGGSSDEPFGGMGIAINMNDEAYVIGSTISSNFPTTIGAYDRTYAGGVTQNGWASPAHDVFVIKLNAQGSNLIYSTLIGGNNSDDKGFDIVLNSKEEAFITGYAENKYPFSCGAYDKTFNGGAFSSAFSDIFVSKLSANGDQLIYSTYFGGNGSDYFNPSLVLIEDVCEPQVVIGFTSHSNNIPTSATAYDPVRVSNTDRGFIASFKPIVNADFVYTSPVCGQPVTFTDMTVKDCGLTERFSTPPLQSYYWDFGDGTQSTLQNPIHIYSLPGNYTVKLVVDCPKASITKLITVVDSGGCASISGCPVCFKNGSFEDGAFCESDKVNANNWSTCGETPDDQPCAGTLGWGTTYPSLLPSFDGNWYVGMSSIPYVNIYEGVTQQLCEPLEAGVTYNISVAVAYSTAGYYTEQADLEVWCGTGNCAEGKLLFTAHAGSKSWQVVTGTFTPTTNCQYLTFRNNCQSFLCKNSYGKSYLLLDDIKITKNGLCNCINPPKLTLNSISNETCSNANGTATVSVNSGTGVAPFTYSWNTIPPQTVATATNLKAGTYKVITTDKIGCKDSLTLTISNTDIVAGFTKGTAACSNCGCKEWLMVNATGGTPPYTYQWPDGYDKRYKNKVCPGNYSVKITDKNGCSVNVNVSTP